MLVCKHCSTPNSLDSTFCKKCGTAVPADQRREAALELDKLVDEGLVALNAGRTAEALAIADTAVATDPTHLGALHLKSAVHERRGEIADALESAERIVELNPDSELDRIKRNGLRTTLLNASTPVQPDRRVAFAAAAAAMVLVSCAAILVVRANHPAEAPRVVSTLGSAENPIIEPTVPTPQTQTQVAPPTTPATGTTAPAPSTPATDAAPTSVELPTRDRAYTRGLPPTDDAAPVSPGTISTNLPSAGPLNGPNAPTVMNPALMHKDTPTAPGGGDPSPTVLKEQPQDDPGQIEISVSRGNKRAGGSEMVPDSKTNGSAAYAQVGTERFQLGDYNGAAVNLEKAVAGGGDPVGLNLRLAQAYANLGRKSDAAAAYERARGAANAALAGGRGNRERLQAQRDAADAGLKTVRGG